MRDKDQAPLISYQTNILIDITGAFSASRIRKGSGGGKTIAYTH